MRINWKFLLAFMSLQVLASPLNSQTESPVFRQCVRESNEYIQSGKMNRDFKKLTQGNQAAFNFLVTKSLADYVGFCEDMVGMVNSGLTYDEASTTLGRKWLGEAVNEWQSHSSNPQNRPVLQAPAPTFPSNITVEVEERLFPTPKPPNFGSGFPMPTPLEPIRLPQFRLPGSSRGFTYFRYDD